MEVISEYIDNLRQAIGDVDWTHVLELIQRIDLTRKIKGTIYVCGNGGSAANATHFANDLSITMMTEVHKRFNAIALTDSTSIITAISNDIDYDDVFKFQLLDRITERDILLGLSGSGNSENVIRAFQYAHDCGAITCAIVGETGGRLKHIADIPIYIPIMNMQISEDIQLVINHVIVTHLMRMYGEQQK